MKRFTSLTRVTLIGAAISLVPLLPGATRADSPGDPIAARAGQVDGYVQTRMQSLHIPGAAVGIIHNGALVLSRSYGSANIEQSTGVTPNTPFQVDWLTEPFTATAVLMLADSGKLNLAHKIGEYVSDLPAAWQKVSVRQLLTHTSGLPDYMRATNFSKTIGQSFTRADNIARVANDPVRFQPGAQWAFSATDYYLLGMLIERVSGTTYARFMDKQIFQPLNMTSTRVNDFAAIIKDRAAGYHVAGDSDHPEILANGDRWSPSQSYAAAGLVTNVPDLAKFYIALSSGQLLKKTSLTQMWGPATLTNELYVPYGLGWQVVNYQRKGSYVARGGSVTPLGFSSGLIRYTGDGVAVIVLTNHGGVNALKLADDLHTLVTATTVAP